MGSQVAEAVLKLCSRGYPQVPVVSACQGQVNSITSQGNTVYLDIVELPCPSTNVCGVEACHRMILEFTNTRKGSYRSL